MSDTSSPVAELPFVCDQPDCNRTFSRIQGLRRHQSSTHNVRSSSNTHKWVACPECPKKLRSDGLRRHLRQVHGIYSEAKRGRPSKAKVEDWSPDDIFASVLTVLYPDGAAPLTHLSALAAFRAACADLLEATGRA